MEHGNTGNNKEVGIDDLTLLCIEVSHSGEGDKSNLSSLMFLLRELDVSGQSRMEMNSASDEGKGKWSESYEGLHAVGLYHFIPMSIHYSFFQY